MKSGNGIGPNEYHKEDSNQSLLIKRKLKFKLQLMGT